MPAALTGEKLYDGDGNEIGKITDVISNPTTLETEWMTVKTGLLSGEHLVPVAAIDPHAEGVVVPFDKAMVKDAPDVDAHAALTAEQRRALLAHYGLPDGEAQDA